MNKYLLFCLEKYHIDITFLSWIYMVSFGPGEPTNLLHIHLHILSFLKVLNHLMQIYEGLDKIFQECLTPGPRTVEKLCFADFV